MIDYERSFKKLVAQIKMESGFAVNNQFNEIGDPEFNKGMVFAYSSIERLAIELEEGRFFNDEDFEEEAEVDE